LLLRPGPRLPALLRAVRRGLLFSVPRRGGPDAPRAGAPRLRPLAPPLPAAGLQAPDAAALARRRDRSHGPPARPSGRPQPLACLDAARHRARIAGLRRAPRGAAEGRRRTRG